MRILVSAASRYGSTAEIARSIGEVLSERGFDVSVIPPEEVATIEGYDAVILGSAVYTGHWLDPAKEFVRRFADDLATRHVWLFSSGPVGDPSKKMVQKMGEDPLDVAEILATTKAEGHRVFAGKLDRKNLKGAQRASLLLFRGLRLCQGRRVPAHGGTRRGGGLHGVQVFSIGPGFVRTAMIKGVLETGWLPEMQAVPADAWVGPERVADLVVLIATGRADALSGRFLFALDDIQDLIRRPEEIRREDLYTVRLRR